MNVQDILTDEQLQLLYRNDLLEHFQICHAELSLLWDTLPGVLQTDPEFLKYKPIEETAEKDTTQQRQLICCFCKIRKLRITSTRKILNLCSLQ